jgi:hypothetical protein
MRPEESLCSDHFGAGIGWEDPSAKTQIAGNRRHIDGLAKLMNGRIKLQGEI